MPPPLLLPTPAVRARARLRAPRAADAETRAVAKWAQEVAEVLLGVILTAHNSERSRSTAVSALAGLGEQLGVHVGVWLAPVLGAMTPPLMARKIIPVRVRTLAAVASVRACLHARVCVRACVCTRARPFQGRVVRFCVAMCGRACSCRRCRAFFAAAPPRQPLTRCCPCRDTPPHCAQLRAQSVQQVMGQVAALTWALSVDPALFAAGPEVLSAAKEAFALADRDEMVLLQRLVSLRAAGATPRARRTCLLLRGLVVVCVPAACCARGRLHACLRARPCRLLAAHQCTHPGSRFAACC